ncbi:MAG: DegV family protein [Schaedlerella sp.]|nr:DegV family protein [Schaedlerella sp.]
MRIKLVADSSANLFTFENTDFSSAPLKIVAGEMEYIDDEALDAKQMMKDFKEYKGKSGTACPGVGDWLDAFDGADIVYCVAITSQLSGCYNAASIAAEQYMEENPGKKVFILDSLSTGPEMVLILEKYRELIAEGKGFEEVCQNIKEYHKYTNLLFSLESVDNLAKNGRVSTIVAKAVGILGIRIVGRAEKGQLEPMHKCRGEKKALMQLIASMKELGCNGKKVRISHSYNDSAVEKLVAMIKEAYPESDVSVGYNHGLCCFYAEAGGILLAFESDKSNK